MQTRMMGMVVASAMIGAPASAAENLQTALAELADQVVSFLDQDTPKKIAISTIIHGDGLCSDLSERASNRFQGALFQAKTASTQVIDRRSLSAIFREQDLVEDGTLSPDGAAKIARIAQVDAIVTGTLTRYAQRVELEASMLDAVSGTVLGFAYSDFPLTSTDEGMMVERSSERCGFSTRAQTDSEVTVTVQSAADDVRVETAKPTLPTFESEAFNAEVSSVYYASATGEATFTLRFTNTTEKEIALAYIPDSLTISDGRGGVLTRKELWSGLRTCNTSLAYCNGRYPKHVTRVASGQMAQLTFDAAGAQELDDPVLSITFELVVTPDADGDKAHEVVSVGFFDVKPTVR